jgi:hypothetical protein
MGELLFEELRERHALPNSYEEAARFVNDLTPFEVDGYFERLLAKIGHPGARVPKRRYRQLGEGFRMGLSRRLSEHFTTGKRTLGSGISWASAGTRIPIGSIAAEDIAGGTWTQLLMWTAHQVKQASDTLKSKGANSNMTLRELLRIDEAASRGLIEAHVTLGTLPLSDELSRLAPWSMARIESAAAARSKVAGRGFIFGAYETSEPLAAMKSEALSVLLQPRDTGDINDPSLRAAVELGLVNKKYLIDPLLQAGLVRPPDVLDRIFMPLRIRHGARWDHGSGQLVGGPDSLELYSSSSLPGLGYFPFILLSLPVIAEDPANTTDLLIDRRLQVWDATQANQVRVLQVNWMLGVEL